MKTLKQIIGNVQNVSVSPNVEITPEMATQLMGLNSGNRPLNSAVVSKYADMMRRGEWKFTGDTIAISNTYRLLNGQHRLSAIIKSGIPQKYNIQTGLEDSVFDVLDTGKNRTSSDVLSIAGYSYTNTIPSAVKIIDMYYSFKIKNTTSMRVKHKMSNTEILKWIDRHDAKEALEKYAQIAVRLYGASRFLSHSTYCAFLYIFGNKNRDRAIDFFETLASGENISASHRSSIFLLRKRLIDTQLKSIRMSNQDEKWALLIKAWNAFRDNRELKQLSYNPDNEPFPVAK